MSTCSKPLANQNKDVLCFSQSGANQNHVTLPALCACYVWLEF